MSTSKGRTGSAMAPQVRGSTSYSTASNYFAAGVSTRPGTSASVSRRPSGRPMTAMSVMTSSDQQLICAISESRGISPIVGLAFVNLTTTEAVLCQITDNQTYTKTEQKLRVYEPSEIVFMETAAEPKSILYSMAENNVPHARINHEDRGLWEEQTGTQRMTRLAIKNDLEAMRISLEGNYYATCCFAAAIDFVEQRLGLSFPAHSLRIKFEPSQDTMMIDRQTCKSLEMIQNLQRRNSKHCLYGVLDQTLTNMGRRRLRINVCQPSTDEATLRSRYDAVDELSSKQEMFSALREALKLFKVDVDKVLTNINIIKKFPSPEHLAQQINYVLMLKQYIKAIPAVYEALNEASSPVLMYSAKLCHPDEIQYIDTLIDDTINHDTIYQKSPLELRNQRTYAIKAGVDGELDVARQTYKEANSDVQKLVSGLEQTYNLAITLKYDEARNYYLRMNQIQFEERPLPAEFINAVRKKSGLECQTLSIMKHNLRIRDSHHEVLRMSDGRIKELIGTIRLNISPLFLISNAIANLDMLASFAQLVTTQDYCKPDLTTALGLKNARHPIMEKIRDHKFRANDAFASRQSRFNIITGCNMSGKSTFIRTVALVAVMAQIGSFVPAELASVPIFHQLFTRVSVDDRAETNASTFSLEMREMAFILRNVDSRSMVIIDELGRGTSTTDGLHIAIAIAEALIESQAFVWFVTHFRELPRILQERAGVVNLHLAVDFQPQEDRITMLYQIASGYCKEEGYGIAMARVVDLPPEVIEVAEAVSKEIRAKAEMKGKSSATIAVARRRRLILGLKEQLDFAKDGNLQGPAYTMYMKELQDEFVERMLVIDEELRDAVDAESEAKERDDTVMTDIESSAGNSA